MRLASDQGTTLVVLSKFWFRSSSIVDVPAFCQRPVPLQIWFWPPWQRIDIGTHWPPHTPAPVQTNGHAGWSCHAPAALHSCGSPVVPHRRVPGTHVPPHTPAPVQTNGHAGWSCHAPAALHS